MTTGSIVSDGRFIDPPSGGLIGRRRWRDWNGGDSPVVAKVKRPPRLKYTTVRNGKKVTFTVPGIDPRPPKRARKKDEYHPYFVQRSVSYDSPISTQNGDSIALGSFGNWTAPGVDLIDANERNSLINKINEKVKGSGFNAAIALGEGREVLSMIGGTAIKLAKAIHHLRKGDIYGAERSLLEGTDRRPIRPPNRTIVRTAEENLSSYWLEIQYGWRPLLGDVKAGAEFLANRFELPIQTTFHARIRQEKTEPVAQYPWGPFGSQSDKHTLRVRAVLSETPSLKSQLGLLDPELVAWELLPYSFVIDWFLPVGNWLEARAASSSLVGQFYFHESKARRVEWANLGYNPNPPYSANVLRGSTMPFTESISSNRWRDDKLKPALPVFQPLRKAASVMHCLNAIALLSNLRVKG